LRRWGPYYWFVKANNNDKNNNIEPVQYGLDYDVPAHAEPAEPAEPAAHKVRNITKRARTKFKLFHRKSLRRFHKLMKKQNKKSVKSRNPTPRRRTKHIPAYLRR